MPLRSLNSELLNTILASANIATWSYDIKTGLVTGDAKLASLFGIPLSEVSSAPLSQFLQAIHVRDLPRVQETLAQAITQRGAFEAYYRVHPPPGEVRYLLARGYVEADADGQAVRLPGAIIDITEWKVADHERAQFVALVENSRDLIAICSPDGYPTFMNAAGLQLCQLPTPDAMYKTHMKELFFPQDRETVQALIQSALAGQPCDITLRFQGFSAGRRLWMSHTLFPLRDEDGNNSALALVSRDVTEQKRAEQALEMEKTVLHQIANDTPFPRLLEELAITAEQASLDDMLVSILLLDSAGRHLHLGAAPSLPEAYNQAIEGIEIGPEVGSCGTAAFKGQAVFVGDIATDPLWSNFSALALEHGLAACSSQPIFSLQGKVTGTLAMYYRTPGLPGEHDRALMDSVRYLAGLVIERERAREALRRNEEEFLTLANSIPQLAWMARPDGHIFWYNQRWFEYTGTTPAEMDGWGWRSVHDPTFLPLVERRWRNSIETGTPFEMEFPIRGADGHFRSFLTRVQPVRDADGKVLRWFGTNTDVDDQRRNAERVRTLVQATSQAIWSANAQGQITEHSSSWTALTGQRTVDMQGDGWLEAIYSGDRQAVASHWQHCVATGEVFHREFRVWSVQNRFLYLRAHGVPVLTADGDVSEWIVANTDITEQVEAQQQLRERARHAAFRNSLKEVLASDAPIAETLRQCCESFITRLDLDSSLLWLLDAEKGCWQLLVSQGCVPPHEQIATLALTGNEVATLAQFQRGHLNNSVQRTLNLPIEGWLLENNIEAMVGQPIWVNDKAEGVLVCFSREVLPVNLVDEVRDAGDAIGVWLKRRRIEQVQSRLLEQEQSAREQAETLLSLVSKLAAEPTLKGFVQSVTDAGTLLTTAMFGAFFYNAFDELGEKYMLYTIAGVPAEKFSHFPMPYKTKIFAPTFDGEGTVCSPDILADPRYGQHPPHYGLPKGHLPVRSYLAVSVKRKNGEVIGGLFFGHPDVGRFTPYHVRLAESVAAHAAFGFDRAPLN